jgi:hypothetical protein
VCRYIYYRCQDTQAHTNTFYKALQVQRASSHPLGRARGLGTIRGRGRGSSALGLERLAPALSVGGLVYWGRNTLQESFTGVVPYTTPVKYQSRHNCAPEAMQTCTVVVAESRAVHKRTAHDAVTIPARRGHEPRTALSQSRPPHKVKARLPPSDLLRPVGVCFDHSIRFGPVERFLTATRYTFDHSIPF